MPTSFLAGRTDVLASAHDMRTAAERIPGATYRVLRATHFLPMERPAEVHEELLALLARVPGAAPARPALADEGLRTSPPPQGSTSRIRSSRRAGSPRPSRLDVVTHSRPSGAVTTVRIRP